MQFPPFSISRLPRIDFGSGRIAELPALVAGVVLAVAGLTGLVLNATRPNVKGSSH